MGCFAAGGSVVAEKTVAQKAHVKPGTTIAVLKRVVGVVESLGLPKDTRFATPAKAQLVFLFVRTRTELEKTMPSAVKRMAPGSALWVFFKKGRMGHEPQHSVGGCGAARPAPPRHRQCRRDVVGISPEARRVRPRVSTFVERTNVPIDPAIGFL
jgi:hypothetical protein